MKITRRNMLISAGLASAAAIPVARSQSHEGHDMSKMQDMEVPISEKPTSTASRASGRPGKVRTLNGWTLPYRMNNGVKATCWGYNGSTPGPTIEATEGDRVRIYVTNRLKESTSMHWHGLILPNGMDGVGGLTQAHIKPGETYVYEFTLRQHGSHMYHPHADEMTQMAMGMMGLFIIHPKAGEAVAIDRDYAFILHNFALHPGTHRPDPSVMQDFDLWTFNSKTFPAIDSMVARTGERVRIRVGNLSMWNHPIHLHGVEFLVT
jgi:manganese oxidase